MRSAGGVGVSPAPRLQGNIIIRNERFSMRTGAGGTPTPQAVRLNYAKSGRLFLKFVFISRIFINFVAINSKS